MIRTGRRPRVSVSLNAGKCGPVDFPHIVRRVNESRRFLVTTETILDTKKDDVLDPREKEKQQDSIPVVTIFMLENLVPGPRARAIFNGLKKDSGYHTPEADNPWFSESESDTPDEEDGPVKLRLRGGCLKLPEREGSKRRLGDEDKLPTLVWWAAGGQVHQKPLNGRQLREWKRKSDGYDKGNKKRGWIREFAFVMTSGRVGRNSEKPKAEGSQEDGGQGDAGGGDGGGSGGTDA